MADSGCQFQVGLNFKLGLWFQNPQGGPGPEMKIFRSEQLPGLVDGLFSLDEVGFIKSIRIIHIWVQLGFVKSLLEKFTLFGFDEFG